MPPATRPRGCGSLCQQILSSLKPTPGVVSGSRPLSSVRWHSHVQGHARQGITDFMGLQAEAAKLYTSALHCRRYATFSKPRRSCVIEQNGDTYIRSPYPDVQIPEIPFTEFMFSFLDKHKDLELVTVEWNVLVEIRDTLSRMDRRHAALELSHVDDPTGRTYTGAQLKESTIRVASALHKLGYRKGDVVLMLTANCPEYMLLLFACGLLGCPVSTANPAYTAAELQRQLVHCKAKCVVTTTDLLPTVTTAIATNKDTDQAVKEIITIDGPADECRPFQTLLDDDGTSLPENVDISPKKDVLVMPYSSGTTGLPKGVMISHYHLVAYLCQKIYGPARYRTGEDILLGMLPFFHIYGILILMSSALVQGAKLVVLPKFEPQMFLQAIQKHKMTYIHIVPPLALFLAKHPMVDDYDLSAVNTVLSGAAPLGGAIVTEVENRLNVNCFQGYGSTELTLVCHDEAPGKKGTVGRLLPNILAKVIEPSTGRILPPGKEGELVFNGPQVMMGYLKNREATDACIKDGWGYTGDIGRVDEEGYFTITDRLKELIKYKAYAVAPAELEALLVTHNSIQDAAVIGLKAGEDVGEIPKAFVVAKPGLKVTAEEITKFIEKNVAPYKRLRGGVEFVTEIPKTPSGKILRRLLKR